MTLPVFETKRLILREPKLEDAPSYQKHFADWDVVRVLNNRVPWPYPPDGAYEYLNNHIIPNQGDDQWTWGIFLKDHPLELIGGVELAKGPTDNRGFWLGKKFWGQGLIAEALVPIMDYAFETLGFEKMHLTNALENVRSRRVKEKNGARFLRIEPGEYIDRNLKEKEIWELTKSAWVQHRPKL